MATITTLGANDSGSTSRSTINTNFTNLNNQVQIIYKSADETVNNSTTLQNDDHLLLPVLVNEVWEFKLFLFVNSGTIPDLKWQFTVPAGTSYDYYATVDQSRGTEASIGFLGGSDVSDVVEIINGLIIVSSTPGNVQLQWAQNTANPSNTKLLKGSYIIAHKLA